GEINQKIEKETTEETETSLILPILDSSTSKSLDSEEALSNEIETKDLIDKETSVDITSKAEVEIQDEEETRSKTVTKKEKWWFRKKKTDEVQEKWQEKEDVAVLEVQITATPSTRRQQKPINLSLIVPLLLVIIISGVLLLPYVLPTTQYIATIEKIATNSVGEPVKVGSLRVSLLPIPNLDASNITIGNTIKIRSAILTFSMLSSFSSNDLSKIELIGVNILPGAYDRIIKWTRSNNAPQLSNFRQIYLKNTKLEFENIAVPLLNGNIDLIKGSKFSRASFATSDDKIKINVTPKRKGFLLNISTKEWKPLHSSSITFSSFDAKAIASSDSFYINEMDGRIYEGVFKGTASAKWSDGWIIKGQLEMERVNLGKATKSFNSDIPVRGNLTSNIEIASNAPVYEQLSDSLHINGIFQLQNGFIKVDLGNSIRSISKGDIAGGQTKFDDLSGSIEGTGNTYQLRQLKLSSGILSAEGNLVIGPSKELSGKVISNLKGTHTMTSGPVSLEGTIKAPVLIRHHVL
ncbi:MAG: AsmA-like C-terminal region-containing protein, partial [Nitrosomonadaceae bacterium]